MDKVIEIQNLKKSYPLAKGKSLEAIKGTSFFVGKGEIFGILGPNGAGKTTTLEIIEGLKRQTDGLVTVLGFNNITQADEIKKRIGVQLQSADYLPYLTLGELLDLFASLYSPVAQAPGLPKQEKQATGLRYKKLDLLKLVDLQEKENEQVKNLSGGQKQRFTIATSLVNRPEILFLDEPTTGLDPAARRNLWDLVKKINARGISIVLTTHYMEEAEFLCHRVAIMDHGEILKIDEPRKLIEQLSGTVQVSFLTSDDCDAEIFKSITGVKKVYSQAPKTIIDIENLDKVASVIEKLKASKITFSGFTVKTASLEDVYLQLTGREYQE